MITLFYFVFEGNFQVEAPWGAILRYQFGRGGVYLEGFIHGGAYFRNFTLPVGVILDTYVSKEYSECSNSCVEWA